MTFEKYRKDIKFGLSDDEADNFTETLRRLNQAREALQHAAEAEDFQSVGMRCREALLTLIRECGKVGRVSEESSPKQADFLGWIELIANNALPGPSVVRLRSYVKTVSLETWKLVQWLTHARRASRYDAEISLDATINIGLVVVKGMNRWLSGAKDWNCPACGSYQLNFRNRGNDPDSLKYELYCEVCGWGDW